MEKRALVVDNDFFFVEFLTELLEKRGYEVVKAYDGKEGISKLDEGPYRVIFSDIVMPRIDGQHFIQYTRKVYPGTDTLIIAISGTLIERQEEIDLIGADCYLAKGPIEKMADHIESVLDKFEPASDSSQFNRTILEPGDTYPNPMTVELLDKLNFERAMVESIGIGIMVLDGDTRVIMNNAMSLEIVQKPLKQVLSHVITDVLPPTEKRKMVGALKRIIEKPTPKRISFSASIQTIPVRIIVSSFMMKSKSVGWIIAMVPQ